VSSLFKSTAWTGEFFHPDLYQTRFSGSLEYSPEDGVVLTYRKADDGKIPETPVLHGILDSGDMCTLFGKFSLSKAGFTVRNGFYSSNGKCRFERLLVGAFVRDDFKVDDLYFTLSGLQDFLVHEGAKYAVKFEQGAIQRTALPFGTLELRTSAIFGPLPDDVSAAIYSHESEAAADLTQTFSSLRQRHPNANFMLKKDLEYTLRLRLDQPTGVLHAHRHVSDICNLFALLLDSPTYPEQIDVRTQYEAVGDVTVSLYPSIGLNPATVELARRQKPHVLLPLNASNLSLPAIFAAWLNSDFRRSVLVSAMQHEIGFRTAHSAHGDIVLYASQLESISHSAGRSRDKYEYPMAMYGTAQLAAQLERALGVTGAAATAAAISDLRNEIAHVGRPRTYLSRMSLSDLMQVARCLQLVIAAFTLRAVGVAPGLTDQYVDKLLPR